MRRRRLEHAFPALPGPLELQACAGAAVAPGGVHAWLPRNAPIRERPKSLLAVRVPCTVPDHALAKGRDLLDPTRAINVAHAGVGSSTGTGLVGTGSSRGAWGRGPRTGSGSCSGSTMIGTDSPGSPTTRTLSALDQLSTSTKRTAPTDFKRASRPHSLWPLERDRDRLAHSIDQRRLERLRTRSMPLESASQLANAYGTRCRFWSLRPPSVLSRKFV